MSSDLVAKITRLMRRNSHVRSRIQRDVSCVPVEYFTDEIGWKCATERRVSECGSLPGRTTALDTLDGTGGAITLYITYGTLIIQIIWLRPRESEPIIGKSVPTIVVMGIKLTEFRVYGLSHCRQIASHPFHHLLNTKKFATDL